MISRVVEAVRPTVIYTHSLHDVHQDHRNRHRAALVAVREVGRVYCFQSPSATVDFRPTRFVAIDEQMDGKLEAIDAFASQVEIRGYLEPRPHRGDGPLLVALLRGALRRAFEVVREAAWPGSRAQPGPGHRARGERRRGRRAGPARKPATGRCPGPPPPHHGGAQCRAMTPRAAPGPGHRGRGAGRRLRDQVAVP